ncbi:carboxyl-terminal protease [Ferrimonas balearica DSM 9799]|uniref:Carboxyl-terminal protease n=1 Tax=Ferrimonas balearica (strain DSM 9799 / CCM 4581 / KCTC 23876 / PAT) TaxID=550540 RepID=E1SR21_FERBD|nr:S41 family peptidase [Ferrimonas balearica]ADN77951.1 carboxyl-terminal protease [Ferrimonas balearica DSM 9799]
MRRIIPFLVGLLLCASSAFAGQEYHKDAASPTQQDTQALVNAVQELIEDYYVDEVDQQALLDGALKGMLEVLDPHSTYLRPHTLSLLRDNNRGHYYGYGLEVSVDEGEIRVVSPMANSSAEYAGVQPGDVLLKVDELEADPDDLDPMIAYIKQASLDDRPVHLTLRRDSEPELLVLRLLPSEVEVVSSESHRLPGNIGYLRITSFNQRTASEIRLAAHQLSQAPLDGLVLDLRNNPGGLLDAAVQVADMFLSEGVIVTTHGRFFDANSQYSASRFTLFRDLPVVVIINEGSASAAEILAGALQDQGRALLVGERSFGKGTVQSLIPLLSGGGAIKLTTARYATPNGTFIDQQGIDPDVAVEAKEDGDILSNNNPLLSLQDDPQLLAAYDLLVPKSAQLGRP